MFAGIIIAVYMYGDVLIRVRRISLPAPPRRENYRKHDIDDGKLQNYD